MILCAQSAFGIQQQSRIVQFLSVICKLLKLFLNDQITNFNGKR